MNKTITARVDYEVPDGWEPVNNRLRLPKRGEHFLAAPNRIGAALDDWSASEHGFNERLIVRRVEEPSVVPAHEKTNQSVVTVHRQIVLPAGWELVDSVQRAPNAGEFFLAFRACGSVPVQASHTWPADDRNMRVIVRPTWVWPDYLKNARHILMYPNGCWVATDYAVTRGDYGWTVHCSSVAGTYSMPLVPRLLPFELPVVDDWRDSLRTNPNFGQ